MNRTLTATEALSLGLVTEIVPDDRLMARAQEIASDLACGPTAAYVTARRLLRQAHHNSYGEHLAAEADAIVNSFRTPDGLEGVRAFRERRPPSFNGV
jgi:2-(1,2-epoxy-1,2-dihydrophenyl)acetyl-CoA isomerase